MIDDITGLPLLSSDIYQIPLNTDAIPYNDLQAEARLPRQPMLPDDIIPTIALTTGLRSDGTGEVVHTDDHHAQWVYVVNQPVSSSGGGGGGIEANNYAGASDFFMSGISSDSVLHSRTVVGTSKITDLRVEAILDNVVGGYTRDTGRIFFDIQYRDFGPGVFQAGMLYMFYDPATPQFCKMWDTFQIKYPVGLDVAEYGLAVGDEILLYIKMYGSFPVRITTNMCWRDS